jgi:hypothetical protein
VPAFLIISLLFLLSLLHLLVSLQSFSEDGDDISRLRSGPGLV